MYASILRKKRRMVGWTFAAALVAALFITGTAFAEGEEPPASEPAPAEEAPAQEETAAPAPEEPAPVEEPAAAEEPAEAEAVPEEEALPEAEATQEPAEETEAPAAQESSGGEVLEAAAESGTELVDENGEALDFTSEDSAELLTSGDPYYKVGTKKYAFVFDLGDCPPDAYECHVELDPIDAALAYMATTGLPSDRKLYVEAGTYDGFTVNGMNAPLQLLNGVIGVDGSGSTFIQGGIQILDNTGGFTLQGFTLDTGGGIFAENNNGTLTLKDLQIEGIGSAPTYGVQVMTHTGKVSLEDVRVVDCAKSGAVIDNTVGNYPVTITNSSFISNGDDHLDHYDGLYIVTNSAITLNGVTAAGNSGDGIELLSYTTLTMKQVISGGNTYFNDPTVGFGIYAFNNGGTGTVKMEHIGAANNANGIMILGGSLNASYIESRANLDGYGLYFESHNGGSVKINYGNFFENGLDGLHVYTRNAIYLNSVTADGNSGGGVWLSNQYEDPLNPFTYIGKGGVTITSPKSGGDVMANTFNMNGDAGVTINSRGSVSLFNFDSGNNSGIGLAVDNTYGTGGVTIKTNLRDFYNSVTFNTTGIDIQSNGAVTIQDTSAEYNTQEGLYVVNANNIALTRVAALSNGLDGALLNNFLAPGVRSVTLTDCRFDGNILKGLDVFSNGKITANGLSAAGNWGTHGALLDNSTGTAGVTINPGKKISYFYSGANYFDGNAGYGLQVLSNGSIVLKNVGASYNGQAGLYLENAVSRGSVTVHNKTNAFVLFNGNGTDGIYVRTEGNITLKDVIAQENTQSGADLDNCNISGGMCQGFGSVSILADSSYFNDFSYNKGDYGLVVISGGTIKAANLIITDSLVHTGAYLKNNYDGATGGISVYTVGKTAMNEFVNNNGHGLDAQSNGNISLKNIYAADNAMNGANLTNLLSPTARNITIANGMFYSNDENGLQVDASGNITYQGGYAELNGLQGGDLYALGNITVKGTKNSMMWFDSNGWGEILPTKRGLQAYSYNGKVTVNYVSAYNNNGSGIYINNHDATTPQSVSTTGTNLYENVSHGLEVYSVGPITVKGIISYGNVGNGADLANNDGSGNVTVTTTGGWSANELSYNTNGGLAILSAGNVSITNTHAQNNINSTGIFVDNHQWGTGSVTYSTTNDVYYISENGGTGLYIDSKGSIQIKNKYGLVVSDNGSYGVYAENYFAPVPADIKLDKMHADRNNSSGFAITASRNVIASNLTALDNTGHGAYLFATNAITLKGSNTFKYNHQNGVYLEVVYGDINASGITSNDNMQTGIQAESDFGKVILKSSSAYFNNYGGVVLAAPQSTVYVDKVYSKANGFGSVTESDGIHITAGDYQLVTIRNSAFQANRGDGIDITAPTLPYDDYVKLYKTYYFGNVTSDLNIHL